MLKNTAIAIVAAAPSYLAGAVVGGWLLYVFSSNPHDRSLEAVMTGAFFFGPLAAMLGFALTFVFLRRRRQRQRQRQRPAATP